MANEIHIELDLILNDTLIHLDGNKNENGYKLHVEAEPRKLVEALFDKQFHQNLFLNIAPNTSKYDYVFENEKKISTHTIVSKYGKNEVKILKTHKLISFTLEYLDITTINKILDSIPFISQILTVESTIKSIEVIYLHLEEGKTLDKDDIKLILNDTGEHIKSLKVGFNIIIKYGDLEGAKDYFYLIGATEKGKDLDKDKEEGNHEGKNPPPQASPTEKKKKPVPFQTSVALKGDLKKMYLVLNPEINIAGLSLKILDLTFETSSEEFFVPSLKGIEIGYDNKVISIQGALYHNKDDKEENEEYNGSIVLKTAKFELILLGSYIKAQDFSSVFAFGYLGIPIPLHPAFNIKGLAAGFGMHRTFIAPKISEIENFPLIEVIKYGKITDNPKAFFSKLNKFFAPKKDSLVFIAGLKFNSFNIMDTIAIAIVVLEDNPTINLVGLTSISSNETGTYKPYHLELGFIVSVDINKGHMLAYGQLTENSYILLPKLKLTGGFAFAIWFKDQDNISAGDFVATIGGYHPKFSGPGHYPNSIPRLRFDFKDNGIQFYGRAYFAITPSCMMAGLALRLYTEFDTGIVEGHVTIALNADFIIGWAPFYYKAKVSANIHVVARALFFKLTLDIYAKLTISGPEFGGDASFKIKGHEVLIEFGSSTIEKESLTLEEFKEHFFPASSTDKILSHNITSGIIKKFKDENGVEIIVVNPKDFALEINSEIPITDIYAISVINDEKPRSDFYPVCNEEIHLFNELHLVIKTPDENSAFDKVKLIKQAVPKAIWNTANEITNEDRLSNDNLLNDVCKGIRLEFSKIESTLSKVEVSLYDTLIKEFNKQVFDTLIKPEAKEVEALKTNSMELFDLLSKDESIDVNDLTKGEIEVYKYKKNFLGTYKVA